MDANINEKQRIYGLYAYALEIMSLIKNLEADYINDIYIGD